MKKILVIDDEEGLRFFVKANLELRGDYQVIGAADGKEGIRLAEEQKPDVILLDIIMPKMDGLEVLKRLKEGEKTKSIPVIMLTAKSDDKTRLKALKLHDDAYIVKPFTMSELEGKVENALYREEK